MIITKLIAKPDTSGGGGLIYDEHDNMTLSKNSLKVSPKNPFNDPNLYSIYKQEDVPEWITYTCKKNVEKDFTISSWVYLTGGYYTYAFIIVGDYNLYWNLANNNPHSTSCIYFNDSIKLRLDSVPLNKWVYITCVNSNNQITVYYDGIKQGSVAYNKNLGLDQGGYLFSQNADGIYKRGIYGYIFDFFISDKAIWLKNFTPPIRPFDDRSLYLDTDKNIWGCSKL